MLLVANDETIVAHAGAEKNVLIVELIRHEQADVALRDADGIFHGKAYAEPFAFELAIYFRAKEGGGALTIFDCGHYVELFGEC